MGTVVEDGKGKGIVVTTGSSTEIGKVAKMVNDTKEGKTPLQIQLGRLSKLIGLVISVIVIFIFIEGVIAGNSFLEMFVTSIAVAVAAIPEGLPVALTVILSLGMQRILARRGLVRKLLAAETLGGTSVIATDKTCTLTEGIMAVGEIFSLKGKKSGQKEIMKTALICSEAFIENPREDEEKWILRGRPTDKALLLEAEKFGLDMGTIMKKEEEVDEIVFDSTRKYAAALHKVGKNKYNLYVLGAPEKLISFSKMSAKEINQIEKELERLAEGGHRIVAVAKKSFLKYDASNQRLEGEMKELNFLGLIALHDPLRKDAAEAMREVIKAGIRPIIVTGDHKLTAKKVAKELGFDVNEDNILEGRDLDLLSDKELNEKLNKIKIFARVEPKHKLRIVEAWQKRGEVVAMTGDGINDAPALKRADIGVALGSGTEVAKETSDLILLDDNFNIIVAAVEEGRAILDNIRKVIVYLLTSSFSEVILIGGSLIAGLPLPVLPAQLLWVNLVEDGLPDIALAFEPKEDDLMIQKPKRRDFSLLNKEMKVIIFAIGIFTDLLLLGLYIWLLRGEHSLEYVRTMMFAALAVDSLLYVLSCKSLRKNLWKVDIFSNKFLMLAIIIGISILFIAVYLPPLQVLLRTVSLSFPDWLLIFGISTFELVLIEAVKWYFIKEKQI
jgi:Ca2+-transporting ATPase